MSLAPGSRFGSYEILELLGAGGMGEVYRARDSRLQRDVAIKVLPEVFVADPERLARFTREAQTLAALNHPNIASIYGVEETAGMRALVMELVEGDDLSHRISRGAVPFEEALPIARQIADALEAAHELGIVHRDLKPGNVRLRRDGTVKVLDFGLAKALEPAASGSAGPGTLANSPTMAPGTAFGVILGTAAYMSPEQARGSRVDKRTDVWAFGVVLFEMLSGRRLFSGETISDTLAEVLKGSINWSALPAETPPQIRRLLGRCLERDPRRRLHDIADARLDIDEALSASESGGSSSLARGRGSIAWWIACGMCLAAGSVATLALRPSTGVIPSGLRFAFTPQGTSPHNLGYVRISPDGRHVLYEANGSLWIRDLSSFDTRAIPGTEGGRNPFFAPDGNTIGFYARGKMRKVSVDGGDPETICDVADESSPGADWGVDGNILFTPTWNSGLWRVSASGGQPVQITTPNRSRGESAHFAPQLLRDARHVLFTIWRGNSLAQAEAAMLDVSTGKIAVLLQGSFARLLGNDQILYFHLGSYHLVPFDAGKLAVSGEPRPAVPEAQPPDPLGASEHYVDVSQGGRVVYIPGRAPRSAPFAHLVWIDRHGTIVAPLGFGGNLHSVALAPDQRHAAVARLSAGEVQIWVCDLERGGEEQLTRDGSNSYPVWSPSGDRIAFTSVTRGSYDVRWSPADGSRPPSVLLDSEIDEQDWSWLPDGHSGVFTVNTPTRGTDVLFVDESKPADRRPIVSTPIDDNLPEVSHDGRWILWMSGPALYVAQFPSLANRVQVSVWAGRPHWSSATNEIFFAKDGKLFTATFRPSGEGRLEFDIPKPLFPLPHGPQTSYGISKDASRFLMIASDPSEESPQEIRVVDEGFAGLEPTAATSAASPR